MVMGQFRNFRGLAIVPLHVEIQKQPGDTWGADLCFEHRGPAQTVYIGVFLAYGQLVGHSTDTWASAYTQVTVNDDNDWTAYGLYPVDGVIPAGVQLGEKVDCLKFLCDDAPPTPGPDTIPENPYNMAELWDDEVYSLHAIDYRALAAVYW